MSEKISIDKGILRLNKKIYSGILLSSATYTTICSYALIKEPSLYSGLLFSFGMATSLSSTYLLIKTKKRLLR